MTKSVRDQIISANDLGDPVPVKVPEWGGVEVWLYPMSVGEVERSEQMARESLSAGTGHVLASMVALAVRDASGSRVFEDKDVHFLAAKSIGPINRLVNQIRALSGIVKTQGEADRLVDDAEGNSAGDRIDASSSS